MNYKILKLLVLFLIVTFVCKSQTTVKKDSLKSGEDFYLYPTPTEIFEAIDKEKLSFDKNLLNPTDNEPNYILSGKIHLNLGVYIADLGYCTFFSKRSRSIDYVNAISNLTEDLLISVELKAHLSQEVNESAGDMDSVFQMINNHYYDIMQELDDNKSNSVIYILTTGAYIESFNIALNLIDEYSVDNILLQKIASEKYALQNLNRFTKRFESDPNIASILKYQETILNIFDSFTINEGPKRSFKVTKDGKIKFTGGPTITMSKEQFENLKETVSKIRTEIIN
jgi:hypothetical protein